jgi:hypothetical protein
VALVTKIVSQCGIGDYFARTHYPEYFFISCPLIGQLHYILLAFALARAQNEGRP